MASVDIGKDEIVRYIKNNFAEGSTCLDVGACDGKWFDLLGDYLAMDAVEVWQPNVVLHGLCSKYRNVYQENVADLEYNYYDLIIFGDVIEHMDIRRAQKVLKYAWNRCRDMIIGVPFQWPQGELYGNPFEVHVQPDLTDEVFRQRYPGFDILLRAAGNYAYYHKGAGDSGKNKSDIPVLSED